MTCPRTKPMRGFFLFIKNNSYICNTIMKGSGPDFGLTFSEGVVPLTFFMPILELLSDNIVTQIEPASEVDY